MKVYFLDLIIKLKEAKTDLLKAIDGFPKDKRNTVLFDRWTLKEVMGHISGWNLLRLKELNLLHENTPVEKITDFDACNKQFVEDRKGKSWEYLYNELDMSCKDLIDNYSKINPKLFEKKIWKDSNKTLKDWLLIDLDHWVREHLQEIKKYS